MTLKDRANKFADKFESKSAKLIAFWGSITAFIAFIPSVIAVVVWLYFFAIDLYNISKYVREFSSAIEYSQFMDMQHDKAIHEEMETVMMYGVQLEETNNGDLWYFTTVVVNGVERPILYSANIKKKGQKVKNKDGKEVMAHIYIQNMDNEHEWIPDNK
jgi:hypothetical protein